MFKKFAQCLLLGVFVAALNGCATTDDAGSLETILLADNAAREYVHCVTGE